MAEWDPRQTLDSLGIGESEEPKRANRVAEAIRMELSTLLISRVRDPRLQNVSISRVEVTSDLSLARIYFTVYHDDKRLGQIVEGFSKAKGFMRSHIASTLNLRYTPALEFLYDETAEKVSELDELFQEIANERKSRKDDS